MLPLLPLPLLPSPLCKVAEDVESIKENLLLLRAGFTPHDPQLQTVDILDRNVADLGSRLLERGVSPTNKKGKKSVSGVCGHGLVAVGDCVAVFVQREGEEKRKKHREKEKEKEKEKERHYSEQREGICVHLCVCVSIGAVMLVLCIYHAHFHTIHLPRRCLYMYLVMTS